MCVALCLCLIDEYRTLPRLYKGKIPLINTIESFLYQTPEEQAKMLKPNIQAVLLDFGGTIAYSRPPTWKKYEKTLLLTLKNHGHTTNLTQMRMALDKLYIPNTQGKFKNYTQYWTTFLKKQNIPPQTSLIKNLETTRKQSINKLYRLYNHTIPTLAELEEKYRLALVSNCTMNTRKQINKLGLTKFFKHMSLSNEIGARKPDERIYLDTLNALRLKGHDCIFIADEISDLEGAKALKMKTLLVHQGSSTHDEAKDPNFKPDLECKRISDITRFL
jgi:HAD superfamily hydrolase (TIGR01549 family)